MNSSLRHRLQIIQRLRETEPISRFRVRVHTARDRMLEKPAPALVVATGRAMARNDATLIAAGVAFYASLSLVPLILGLLSLFSFVLRSESAQEHLLSFFLEYLPGAEPLMSDIVGTHAMVRGSAGFLSIVGFFWTATAMFGGINRAFRRAWRTRSRRDFLVEKLRYVVMALAVGIPFCVSMAASTVLEFLSEWEPVDLEVVRALENHTLNILARLVPFAITGLVFFLLYKFLPDAKTQGRYIWPGVLLAAVLFEIAKASFVLYLGEYADYGRVYGALGSVIALLVWVYLCSLILIVGAEFASQYGRMRVRQARRASIGLANSSVTGPPAPETRRSAEV